MFQETGLFIPVSLASRTRSGTSKNLCLSKNLSLQKKIVNGDTSHTLSYSSLGIYYEKYTEKASESKR